MKYLLLDIDDTISPLLYKGADAIQVDSWGVDLSIPKYIVDWMKKFSKKENHSLIWSTHRGSTAFIVSKTIGVKIEDALSFSKKVNYNKTVYWDKLPEIIKFAELHPEDTVICADNDAWIVTKNNIEIPSNLTFIVPSGNIGCLSKEDLIRIEETIWQYIYLFLGDYVGALANTASVTFTLIVTIRQYFSENELNKSI